MVCTLTQQQQKLLLRKVAADIDDAADFNFKTYAKQIYDLINDKTKDPVLATMYVSLLPANIRAVMGVNKLLFRKLSTNAGQIANMEAMFDNFNNVEKFVNDFSTVAKDMVQLGKEIQKSSLTNPPQQEQPSEIVKLEVDPSENSFLSDIPFDNDNNDFLKSNMKVYADAKEQLINNRQSDGSSVINGEPVRLSIVSTAQFNVNDFYPDTKAAIQTGEERIVRASKEGVVLAITDPEGKLIRFNDNLVRHDGPDGKVIYYNLRKPVEGAPFNEADNELVQRIIKDQNVSKEEAVNIVRKKLNLISKVRKYVGSNSNNKVMTNITGGVVNFAKHPAAKKLNIGTISFGDKPFTPYKGIPGRGQKPNVYYFDIGGVSMSVDSPAIPAEIVDKLIQLMTEDITIKQGSKSFIYSVPQKINLFKQFVFVEKDVFNMTTDGKGNLVVQERGVTVNYPTKDAFAESLRDLLTRKVPVKKVDAAFAKGKTKAVNLKTAMYNQIWEQYDEKGNPEYYTIGQVQLRVNDTAFKNNSYNDFNINNGVISVEQKPYYPFIAKHFLVNTNFDVDTSGKIQTTGSVINFMIAPEGVVNIVKKPAPIVEESTNKKEEVSTEAGINKDSVQKKLSPIELLKQKRKQAAIQTVEGVPQSVVHQEVVIEAVKFQKEIKPKIEEQVARELSDAEKWYNASPLSKHFSYDIMFHVVNQRDSKSIAEWTMNGIRLFKGSDYSDLYHESWHGFTQGFLTQDEKTNLYNEQRKEKGTFEDYTGKTVKFSEATDLQIEEYLAEDFREYMIFNGQTVLNGKPVRNGIFRRIFNFLKNLFGVSSVNDVINDHKVNKNVAELYNKLRVGDLSGYTFASENRNFDTLNKALVATNANEVQKSLSFENSNLVFNTVESLFSEAVDAMNQANLDDLEEMRDLQALPNRTKEQAERYRELKAQVTSGYTMQLLSTPEGVRQLYELTKDSLENRLNDYNVLYSTNPTDDLANKIDLLNYTLRNFGDIEKLYKNKRDHGVIGYHMFKSELIQDAFHAEVQAHINEEEELQNISELVDREVKGKDFYDRGGNESSIFDLANREVRTLIKSLFKYDSKKNVVLNRLGFPELVNYREAFAYIARTVQNAKGLVEMYDLLQQEAERYPAIGQLLAKLGPVAYEGQTEKEVRLWSKFFQTMNKYRIPLSQTTVNAQTLDEEGNDLEETLFDIKIGNAIADFKKIDQDWRAAFSKSQPEGSLIVNDVNGNFLDSVAFLKKYPDIQSVNTNPFEFLRDIGIKLKDISIIREELDKQISKGNIRIGDIYGNIVKRIKHQHIIRGLGSFLRNHEEFGIVGQTGPNSNYGKLLTLQSRYSGEYSDFMVQNAAGDPQSEFSQNNSLTQLVKQINAVKSYNELVANGPTSHYNLSQGVPGRPYNPFVQHSVWFKSLFNMDEFEGPKYEGNEIVIENISGINSSINDALFEEGVAASQADEVGKLLNDFHIQLMKYTPELTRHAGKKTSLAVYLRNYKAGARNTRLYVDTENFVTKQGEFNKGFDDYYQIVKGYIAAELDRINFVKMLQKENLSEFDFAYLNRADKFVAFAGVLTQKTKDLLYNVNGDLELYLNSEQGVKLSEQMYDDVYAYFNRIVQETESKINENLFISPSLIKKVKKDAENIGKLVNTDSELKTALVSSFVANNWIQHFEEMIMFYGDIALYKDFFKRNASLNSTGDIIRTDQNFINYVNDTLGRPFAEKLGVAPEVRAWNGILNTAISADVLTKSVYLDEYSKAVKSPTIQSKYGENGVNEADAQGMISFDSYRIILDSLGKWTPTQEEIFQKIRKGDKLRDIQADEIFPVLKMGYYGPLQNDYLPLIALHKFALLPLIPGLSENLDKLHEKMMQEGIDYHTFESGSKVASITAPDGFRPFYSDIKTRELNTTPFVKNKVYAEYLKYQVEAKPKFKGKMTLPTQLRKLAEIGLMENGVPTDFSGSNEEWNSLNESQKRSTSNNYKMRQRYIKSLKELVEYEKNILLSDIGWKRDSKGNLVGDIEPMLELISNELKRSDVGEHEWAYIQTIKNGEIKNSLDISQSADMIEKVIVSLVNKRLINIKVNGEQLVMVSTTGFEDRAFAYSKERNFDKPSQEDIEKYGSNDLPTYHIKNGKIAAAKVKIALQGDFKLLLKHDDVKAKAQELGISPFQALNVLLKDDTWLDQEDHRKMISLIGARIPTQGPNSSDFVEVYEFLPEIAGNIIIAPSEVTSKGGSDFDYDKLPLMMPNIRYSNGKVELAKKYNEDQAKELYNQLLKANIHRLTFQGLDPLERRTLLQTSDRFEKIDKIVAGLLGPDYYDELAKIVQEEAMDSFEVFFDKLNGKDVIENELQDSLRNILEREDNFSDLIRPNDTDLVKPISDEIKAQENAGRSAGYDKEGTRMFEVMHNLKVQQSNSIGKDTLGIGAISNTFSALFDSIGLVLNPHFGDVEFPNRATLLFKHNTAKAENDTDEISMSNRYDNLNENNISDIISQLINGWVDVEKDDWIHYIQGNKEIAPVMLFMLQAGVPIRDIVTFVTHPVIRQYIQEQRLIKGSFAEALGKGKQKRRYKAAAKTAILRRFGFDIKPQQIPSLAEIFTEGIEDMAEAIRSRKGSLQSSGHVNFTTIPEDLDSNDIEKFTKEVIELFANATSPKDGKLIFRRLSFQYHPDKGGDLEMAKVINNVNDAYKKGELDTLLRKVNSTVKPSDNKNQDTEAEFNLAVFLHFIEIENMTNKITELQNAFNMDTTPLQTLTEFYGKIDQIKSFTEESEQIPLVPKKFVQKMLDNSPVGPFYIHEFATELFGRVMPLRNSKIVNDYLNKLKAQDIGKVYDLDTPEARMKFYGIFKNDLFNYIFQKELRTFTAPENWSANAEHPILKTLAADTFVNTNERDHFLYKYDQLREMYPFESILNDVGFNRTLKFNADQPKLQEETAEEFKDRIEKLSYDQFIRDKALYNILNPYQLFKSVTNVADTFAYILNSYPDLSSHFSFMNNVTVTTKDGFTNMMPATMKFTKDEIDVLHENLKDLSSREKLLTIDNIEGKDADYISEFFSKLPLYLYMQSGPTTRSAFSFARIMPYNKILAVLENPVKILTENIDEKYLDEFRQRFILANIDPATRMRFKEFLPYDKTEDSDGSQPTKKKVQLNLFGKPASQSTTEQTGKVVKSDNIITRSEVVANPTTLYLFGDNDVRKGLGGQAKEMRGEKNTIGISTKKLPDNNPSSFKTDGEYDENIRIIKEDIDKAIAEWNTGKYDKIVIPPIGVGLAKLHETAPKTFAFLQSEFDRLEKETNFIKNPGVINKTVKYTQERMDAALGTANNFMSNFHQLNNPIVDEYGNQYWNSEGYYMALRTSDLDVKKEIAETSKQGGKASRAARRNYTLEMDELKRGKYMLDVVRAKFKANPDLATQLINTGDQEIIEKNYWKDDLFGVREDTLQGANVLGKVLMRVRNELKQNVDGTITSPKIVSEKEAQDEINKCKNK